MLTSSSSEHLQPVDIGNLFSLRGKVAIVTGGRGSLGAAMTVALASAGADIVSIERHHKEENTSLQEAVHQCGHQYSKYECDIGDSQALRSCFQKMWADGIKADILLNCAGVQRRADAADFTDEDISLVLDVNIKATLVACQEFAKPLLAEGRPGKIINVASIISFVGGMNITPYAASKGGVLQATKAFSNEWASKGIQCNCIHPGYFHTALTEQYEIDPKYKDFNEYLMSRTPEKRWGKPLDLAGSAVFLASSASDYVSGASVVVDGGFLGM